MKSILFKAAKIFTLFLIFYNFPCKTEAQEFYTFKSPDGRLSAEITLGNNIRFSLKHDNTQILAPSVIGMKLSDGQILGKNPKLQKIFTSNCDETVPAIFYKKSEIKDQFHEVHFQFRNSYGLTFRLYNDGFAYRFTTNIKDSIIVHNEIAQYQFSQNYPVWVSYVKDSEHKSIEQQFFSSFENQYTHDKLSNIDSTRLIFLPCLVELNNGKKLCITESDLENYPGMFLKRTQSTSMQSFFAPFPKTTQYDTRHILVQDRENYIAKTSGTRSFPWRIFIVTDNDKDLTNNDMVYRLASPCRIQDISWIKPGKAAWEWWSQINLSGVDFRAGKNNDTYRYFIDFAAENGIEYVVIDGGWYDQEKGDIFKSIPEIDIPDLVNYGKSKGVDIILWVGYSPFERNLGKAIQYYADMGVRGFKVDFMDRDDQQTINFLYKAAALCAEHHMLLDYHGTCKPAGIQRTYPNVMNFEGVNGLEQVKWMPGSSLDQVVYDVTIPFIRMVAGPMDYTPGAMRNATRQCYMPIYWDPMSQGTRCRQLAAYVIFEAPLNMLCDSPTSYNAEQECLHFIAKIPTIWNETVALQGKVGEYVAIARRSGSEWYLGAMTDWSARTLILNLSFLPEGNWKAEIFKDGINADRTACDYSKEIIDIPSDRKVQVVMAPGGGGAMRIYRSN